MNQPTATKLSQLFGIDLRSLALFRIGTGILIIADLIDRSRDLSAHYTDFGLLPRHALLEKFANVWDWSLYNWSGTFQLEALLFVVAGLCAAALLVGYHTRLATWASWILLVSLQARNPMVLQAGDILLRLMLFWGLFLPLGARYSVDQWRHPDAETGPGLVVSVATIALLLQVCFVYSFSAILKWHPIWIKDGTAVYYALNIDQMTTPLGNFIRQFPLFMKGMTFATYALEALGPFLFFFPWKNGPIRTLMIVIFISLHLGLGLCLELGLFHYIDMASLMVFLPAWFWDRRHQNRHPPIHLDLSIWKNSLALCFLIFIVLWNLQTVSAKKFPLSQKIAWLGPLLKIDQMWGMFAPYPLMEDGWYVIPGNLLNGKQVDLFRQGQPVDWNKPKLASTLYKNQRWQKYMMNIWGANNYPYRLYYGQYLCRDWNTRHEGQEQVDNFEITFMREDTLPNYQIKAPEKVVIWKHYCFKVPETLPVR